MQTTSVDGFFVKPRVILKVVAHSGFVLSLFLPFAHSFVSRPFVKFVLRFVFGFLVWFILSLEARRTFWSH